MESWVIFLKELFCIHKWETTGPMSEIVPIKCKYCGKESTWGQGG